MNFIKFITTQIMNSLKLYFEYKHMTYNKSGILLILINGLGIFSIGVKPLAEPTCKYYNFH